MVMDYEPSISTNIMLSRGQNAPASIAVSFIDAQPEMKPPKEPSRTPNPQDMVKPTGFKPVTSDIELSAAEIRPGLKAPQPAVNIEAIELVTTVVEVARTVAPPTRASAPTEPMEIARVNVRLEDAALEKPDPTKTVEPIAPTVGFNSDPPKARPASNNTTRSTAAEPGVVDGAKLARPLSPEYPPACIRRGQEGRVVLDVQVLPGGRAGEITIFRSSGHTRLDASAIAAARKASFKPAREDGRNVETRVKLPIKFQLE